jgi:hypothetical protein
MLPSVTERAFRLLAAAPLDGCIVEFGVYKGDGLIHIARLAQRYLSHIPQTFGFDSFEGMPLTDRPLEGFLARHWARGSFADTSLEAVRARLRRERIEAELIKGIFANLRPLKEYGVGGVRFAHIDADIYEGYRDALRLLTPHLQIGSVLLFDESVPPIDWRFQSVRHHGRRAVRDWEDASGVNLHLIRAESTVALCVLVDEAYLRCHASLLLRLSRDTFGESGRNIARIIRAAAWPRRRHVPS